MTNYICDSPFQLESIHSVKKMNYLTVSEIIKLEKEGGAFHIYPRKLQICVNGFKYYKISRHTLSRYTYYKKFGR